MLAAGELEHDLLELVLGKHLAMPNREIVASGTTFRSRDGNLLDVVHAIVYQIDLAAAVDLTKRGIAHEPIVPFCDIGANRQAFFRRRSERLDICRGFPTATYAACAGSASLTA